MQKFFSPRIGMRFISLCLILLTFSPSISATEVTSIGVGTYDLSKATSTSSSKKFGMYTNIYYGKKGGGVTASNGLPSKDLFIAFKLGQESTIQLTLTNSKDKAINDCWEIKKISDTDFKGIVDQYDAKGTADTYYTNKNTALDTIGATITKKSTGKTNFSTKLASGCYGLYIKNHSADGNYVTSLIVASDSPTYTITYNTNGGTDVSQATGVTALPNPLPSTTKDDCTFKGWYTDASFTTEATPGAAITANTTLYAKWDCSTTPAATYTVTYNANEGTCATSSATYTEGSAALTLPSATRSGYTFAGWYDAATDGTLIGAADASFTPSSDTTLYAHWTEVIPFSCGEMMRGTVSGTTITKSGDLAGDANAEGIKDAKLNSEGSYIYLTLADGSTFQDGDYVVIFPTDQTNLEIFADKGTTSWGSLDKNSVTKNAENIITLPAAAIGKSTVYLYRTKNNSVNPHVSYMSIVRPCPTYKLTWSADAWTYGVGDRPTLSRTLIPDTAPITYTSSNEAVATISDDGTITKVGPGTTTITAAYYADADDDKPAASASYTLTVTCPDPTPKIKGDGVISGCNESITLRAVQSDDTEYTDATYTFQWYRNNQAIADATSATYTTDVTGTYYVIVTGDCAVRSSNTATITSNVPVPSAKRLTRFQYYRPGNTYPSVSNARHLLAYKSVVADDPARCDLSATIIRGTTHTALTDLSFLTTSTTQNAAGLYEITTTYNEGLRTLDTQLQAGDTLRIKVTPYDNCGEPFPHYADSVDVYVVSKPSLAFIVSGANSLTRNKKNFVIGGDFLNGVNQANLYAQTKGEAWDDADKATVLPLYQTLCDSFATVPVNAYAEFDSLNYEPFDLVFLTDFVKTDAGGDNNKAKCNAAIDNLGRLVDYRPMFSTKGYMAKDAFKTWAAKGFTGNPYDVKTKRDMTVLCYAHDIFTGLPEWKSTGTPSADDSCNFVMRDADENIVIRTLSRQGWDDNKGMQGFSEVDKNSFINITTIHGKATSGKDTLSEDTTLISCAERQTNIEARLMVLCINADATSFITPIGLRSIVRALNYLLVTEPARVSDCSLTFDNGASHTGGGDHKWSNPNNWISGHLPLSQQNVQIVEDCIVDSKDAHAANIKILKGVTLTITDSAALTAIGKVNTLLDRTNSSQTEDLTDPNVITILSSEKGNGAFIHTAKAGELLPATVQLYSKSYREQAADGKYTYYWQYVGIPTQEAQIPQCFYGAYTYVWKESLTTTSKWERRADYSKIYGFEGVGLSDGISRNEKKTYTLQGNLNTTETKRINITAQSTNKTGLNIIGNSWTAPLQIGNFTAADFGSAISPYIHIYNSGKDDIDDNPTKGDYTNTTPGTWTTITPSLVIQDTYTGPTVIPAMQAFYVKTTKDTTFTLDYARLVHGTPAKYINTPLRAPQRNTESVEDDRDDAWAHAGETFGKPESSYKKVSTMRITLADNRSAASLYLMEDDMFSEAYDNGYDAPQLYFNDRKYAPTLFALSELGNMAILAVHDVDNTHLAYRGGSNETCTFSFGYNGDRMLYLNDALLRRSTLISNYNTYSFTVADTTEYNRFYISAMPIDDKTTTSLVEVVQYADRMQLSNPAGEMLTIDIYDAAGRIVTERRSSESMIRIDTPAQNGVYLIHAFGEQTNLLHKIVQ